MFRNRQRGFRMSDTGNVLVTIPRSTLSCYCARLCTCACHSIPGLMHLEPCCGPRSEVHAIFCKEELEASCSKGDPRLLLIASFMALI